MAAKKTTRRKTTRKPAARKSTASKSTQMVTVRVPWEVYEAMKTYSFATQTSLNELALKAITGFLAEGGRKDQIDALLDRAKGQYEVALKELADL